MVAAGGGTQDRRDNLATLVGLAREYAALDGSGSLASFNAWLAATVKGDEPDQGGDAVDLVTFHRAKGLEWPVVFVTGLEKGLVPIGRGAEGVEAEAEERRLLYVALTRAHEELHCTWAERRRFGDRPVRRSPSPWLRTIEAAIRALQAEGPSGDWRRYLDEERRRLRSVAGDRGGASAAVPMLGDDADPAVLAALKAWRARAARAAGV